MVIDDRVAVRLASNPYRQHCRAHSDPEYEFKQRPSNQLEHHTPLLLTVAAGANDLSSRDPRTPVLQPVLMPQSPGRLTVRRGICSITETPYML